MTDMEPTRAARSHVGTDPVSVRILMTIAAYLLHDISLPSGRVDRHEVSPYIRPYRVKGEFKRMTPNSHIWAGRT